MTPSTTSSRARARTFGSPAEVLVGLNRIVEIAVGERDLTMAHYRLISFCSVGPTTPSEIASWLAVRQQNVTRQIDRLVELGLLERSADPRDRRRVILRASDAGLQVQRDVEETIDTYLTLLLQKLDPDEARQVTDSFTLVGTALGRAWDYAGQPGRSDPRGRLQRAQSTPRPGRTPA